MTRAFGRPGFWWRLAVVYVVVLYATLPLGRPVVNWFRSVVPDTRHQFLCVFVILGMVAAALVAGLARQWRRVPPRAWIALVLIACLYAYEFRRMAAEAQSRLAYAEECLHFLEYGVLAWILLNAFSFHWRGAWPYVLTFVLGSLLGWGDEGVQYLTQYIPNVAALFDCTVDPLKYRRYYSLGDVCLNVKGIGYGLLFLALVVRSRRAAEAVRG